MPRLAQVHVFVRDFDGRGQGVATREEEWHPGTLSKARSLDAAHDLFQGEEVSPEAVVQ